MTTTYTTDERQVIARTIIEQLAGSQRRLVAVVAAKDFLVLENGVAFTIMANAGKVRTVRILLADDDTYSMEFGNIRGFEFKVRKSFEGLHVDQLRGVFEQTTELYLTIL
ncbi:hypothetical protein AB0H76_15200 [Nocardia sp. NPDC050712]|uniref:hypothetical protein n=1 Tax=Nocardia sp. NPDC050712 TaxID=3155518 RepID=UPI0033FEE153